MSELMTPRVFIVRHGETEWSLNGRHTGRSDIPLTANGEKRIIATGKALVGEDRLIVPSKLAHVYVSPRKRAQRTFELLEIGCRARLPWNDTQQECTVRTKADIEVTDSIREWDYGNYEGLTSATIREQRSKQGLSTSWNIWSDGCPGGESQQQVTDRLDKLIDDLRQRFHTNVIGKPETGTNQGDVLIVAHGHILRAFAARWVKKDISVNPSLILETGGVGILSYEHHNIDEPAIILGGAFTVP